MSSSKCQTFNACLPAQRRLMADWFGLNWVRTADSEQGKKCLNAWGLCDIQPAILPFCQLAWPPLNPKPLTHRIVLFAGAVAVTSDLATHDCPRSEAPFGPLMAFSTSSSRLGGFAFSLPNLTFWNLVGSFGSPGMSRSFYGLHATGFWLWLGLLCSRNWY